MKDIKYSNKIKHKIKRLFIIIKNSYLYSSIIVIFSLILIYQSYSLLESLDDPFNCEGDISIMKKMIGEEISTINDVCDGYDTKLDGTYAYALENTDKSDRRILKVEGSLDIYKVSLEYRYFIEDGEDKGSAKNYEPANKRFDKIRGRVNSLNGVRYLRNQDNKDDEYETFIQRLTWEGGSVFENSDSRLKIQLYKRGIVFTGDSSEGDYKEVNAIASSIELELYDDGI